jgi:hypothetical protein
VKHAWKQQSHNPTSKQTHATGESIAKESRAHTQQLSSFKAWMRLCGGLRCFGYQLSSPAWRERTWHL